MVSNRDVLLDIRGVLLVRQKPASLEEVHLDYEEFTGRKIRIRVLESLLKNCRADFDVIERGGVKMFSAREKPDSAHISKMFARQRPR